jgi:L-malate glycosyltransferase
MRLCFIAEDSIHIKRWLDYFAQRGHDIHLIFTLPLDDKEEYDSRIKIYQLVRFLPKFWKLTRYLNGVIWLFQIRKLIKKIKPDILNCHYITFDGYYGVASGFHPLVLTAWGSDILITPKNSIVHRILTRISLKKADSIIALSFSMTGEMIKLGASKERIQEILIGVDTNKFKPSESLNIRHNIGILDTVPLIISTRKLEFLYDVGTLVRAIALVAKDIPEIKCIILSEGNQKENLIKLVESLKVRDNVIFLGKIPHNELPNYLAMSNIYVSTSLSDGASNSLLEAMATGLAPIVSDIPANRVFIEEGKNGFLFPIKNHEILAEKLLSLIKNKETRDIFGKLNRDIVLDKADYYKEMAKINSLYKKLTAK